jgi:hypothetical protein
MNQTNITYVTNVPRSSPNAHNIIKTDDQTPSISPVSTDYLPLTATNDSPESIHQFLTIDRTSNLEPQTQLKESYIPNLQPVNPTLSHSPYTLITPVNSIIQSSIHIIPPVINSQPEIPNIKSSTPKITESSTIALRPTKTKATFDSIPQLQTTNKTTNTLIDYVYHHLFSPSASTPRKLDLDSTLTKPFITNALLLSQLSLSHQNPIPTHKQVPPTTLLSHRSITKPSNPNNRLFVNEQSDIRRRGSCQHSN